MRLIPRPVRHFIIALALSAVLVLSSCHPKVSPILAEAYQVIHPEWIYQATLYEVNIRQFTPEGTFSAFEKQLPRLKNLGVDIIWLMPIHPIGEVNRKGLLGSYYSVKDFTSINLEFGTMSDFKRLVRKTHELNLKIIIDWVANHTSHDNNWVISHPDWYVHDAKGKLVSPFDWSDVVKLDYSNTQMRKSMIETMQFWVTEADVDGFRCDVASEIPTDFWNQARTELEKIKPVFMLAEAEQPELQQTAFDADYAWEQHHLMNAIAQGEKNAMNMERYLRNNLANYPAASIRLYFTSNHDENSWNGTELERLGIAAKTFAAFTFVIPGMPLIYNGQEIAFNRRLKFFEKDSVQWSSHNGYTEFYQRLIKLKRTNSTLYASDKGADIERVPTTNDIAVFAFVRENNNDKILAVFNFTPNFQTVRFKGDAFLGEYTDIFSKNKVLFTADKLVNLEPWAYWIFEQ